jgi:hypothetical protein
MITRQSPAVLRLPLAFREVADGAERLHVSLVLPATAPGKRRAQKPPAESGLREVVGRPLLV